MLVGEFVLCRLQSLARILVSQAAKKFPIDRPVVANDFRRDAGALRIQLKSNVEAF